MPTTNPGGTWMPCGSRLIGRSGHSRPIGAKHARVAFLPGHGARQYPLVNLSEDEGKSVRRSLGTGRGFRSRWSSRFSRAR